MPRHPAARLTLAAALCAAALAPAAMAQEPEGRLYADGGGTVNVDGDMLVFGMAVGRASVLRVVDRAGDAQVSVGGGSVAWRRRGAVREYRVRLGGRFMVVGSRVGVEVRGERVAVSAAGFGWVRLAGRGTYALNEDAASRWTGRAIPVYAPSTRTRGQRGQGGHDARGGPAHGRGPDRTDGRGHGGEGRS